DNPVTPSNTDPTIMSLSKTHGVVGLEIEINGAGFGSTQDTGYVTFGGIKTLQTDITQWSDSKIKTKIPVGGKSGKITVYAKGKISNSLDFTVDSIAQGAPYVDEIIPSSFKPGDIIEISGTDFGNAQASGFVDFNGLRPNPVTDYPLWTNNKINVKVPAVNTAGTLYVFQNNKKSNLIIYTVVGLPTITNISPNPAVSETVITITGNNFGAIRNAQTSYVNFKGFKPADNDYILWSNTQIKVKIPANVLSPCKVQVCVEGKLSNEFEITIVQPTPPPEITSIAPNSAMAGELITVNGTNFGDPRGSNYVTFNNIQASASDYQSWTATQIRVKVPVNASSGLLKVNVDGQISNGFNFTVIIPSDDTPVIDYLNPNILQIGQVLEIVGQKFGSTRGTSYITLNGQQPDPVNFTSWSATSIKIKIPVGTQTGNVVVNVNGKSSNAVSLTIQQQNYYVSEVEIPAGSFIMGSNYKPNDYPEETPPHTVNITKPFLMSKYEITQQIWQTIMNGSNPSKNKDDSNPVEQVSWVQAVRFCNELSTLTQLTPCYTINGDDATCNFDANGFRLPTEAEWEYACRAGTTGEFYASIGSSGWYFDNSLSLMHHIGEKSANAFGLFDMHGNALEWCWDWFDPDYYAVSPASDPKGPTTGAGKVFRGGSYRDDAIDCRSARRDSKGTIYVDDNLSFRVVRKK
ncbi:MAG: SUMF1/EgtB/PvdO family nonheme iron enzyme, partial [Bacteroidota bacterium]